MDPLRSPGSSDHGGAGRSTSPHEQATGAGASRRWTRADTARTALALAVAVALLGGAAALHGSAAHGADAGFSLLLGAALGIVCERGRFCFYCIFRDLFEDRNSHGAYAVLTALAVGALGYTVVLAMFVPDPSSGTLPPGAHIGPVTWTTLVAAIAFGLGVVLSGGCIGGHLYRLGEGSVRALPALAGAAVGFGLGFASWNPLYLAGLSSAPSPWLPQLFGYGGSLALTLAVLAVAAVALLRRLPDRAARSASPVTLAEVGRTVFARRWPPLLTGATVGIIVVVAYLRVEPLGVTRQLGSATRTVLDGTGLLPATLHGLDGFAGCATVVAEVVLANGWLILGVVAGSFAAALPGRRFRIERLTGSGTVSAVMGGLLLGWGAMTAIGCTFGVLLSGVSAFALSGWVFAAGLLLALWAGFRLGLHRN
ncbi:YeeE/YedE family protein [Pseudonocardia nematodicida]|uniref:YeeE/YedE family protein n=1 Tax=Pseudonocardia nematodicida TaxID=1206997 RepID=A0ABV1KED2_9PSEU